jgi:acetate---CoA ligase (ADP-forming)
MNQKKKEIIELEEKQAKKEKTPVKKHPLDVFFKAESIAVIGASHEPGKVGNVIFKNLFQRKKVYPVNPNADEIFHVKCYKSVLDIEDKIDLAIIAVKAEIVPLVVEECGKKKIKNVVIVSSGFKEVGNNLLDKKLQQVLEKYKIRCIGPNCLGIYDSSSELDCIFISKQKLKRPEQGKISFLSQSGALGAALLDIASQKKIGIAKFISYGNAINLNESDFLEYLAEDHETKVICFYVEQIKQPGFFEIAKKVSKVKPVVVFKGGSTQEGSNAVLSHTGSLAGDSRIYQGIFKQVGFIQVENLEDLFSVASLFEKFSDFKITGKRIGVITNGGGYGIICTDNIIKQGLELANLSSSTKNFLKKINLMNIENPLDLMGDVTDARYKLALESYLQDSGIDFILAVLLYQTPLLTEEIVEIIGNAANSKKKPIIVVTTRSEAETSIFEKLEDKKVTCFEFPEQAIRAIKKFLEKM